MIINADAIQWAKDYKGELFHALICDPPYHLTTITDRFGKNGSAPAKFGTDGVFQRSSKGFMNCLWDGGDIAFQPETWEAFYNILHPGAFGMAFGGSRTAHRMAVAIEDANFIIHPFMVWNFSTGFPKATRVKDSDVFEGHRYGLQALKPAAEMIIVFQRPYEGRPVDCITETGAGALNIDGGRIGGIPPSVPQPIFNSPTGHMYQMKTGHGRNNEMSQSTKGRWPANFVLTHSPDCQMIGYRDSDSYQINRFTDGAKPFGDGAGHEFESEEIQGGRVPVWECVDGCPVKALDEQSGQSPSNYRKSKGDVNNPTGMFGVTCGNTLGQNDSGGASRFFHQSHWAIENAAPFVYQAKVSVSERNAGLNGYWFEGEKLSGGGGTKSEKADAYQARKTDRQNPHPTLKPIALIEHLATLLLPPKEYAPRRIVVPFAGVASEMIGCWRAGWEEITGIELEAEYAEIGKARLEYWKKQGVQLNLL